LPEISNRLRLIIIFLVLLAPAAGCAALPDFRLADVPPEPSPKPGTGASEKPLSPPPPVEPAEKPEPCSPSLCYQPLPIGSQSPIQLARTSLIPASPYLLDPGKARLRLSTTWVNLWGYKQFSYLLDGEVLNSTVGVDFGLMNRIELGFSYNSVRVGGGIMDSFIERFHRTFRFDDYDRPDFPRNIFVLEFYNKRGERYFYSDDGQTPKERYRGTSATAKLCLCNEAKWLPETALFFSYKHGSMRSHMPEATNTDDYGFGVLAGKKIGDWTLYLNLGEFHFRDNRFGSVRLRSVQRNLFLGTEYRITPCFSVLMQFLGISKAAVNFYDFSKPTMEGILGLRWAFAEDAVLEFGLLENLFEYFNSPDIGAHLGLSVEF
jgi:hypothetical protein